MLISASKSAPFYESSESMNPTPHNLLVQEKYSLPVGAARASRHGAIHLPASTLSRKEEAFLNLAVKLAETSEVEFQHGTVVVKGGSVVALGVNKWRNRGGTTGDTTEYDPHITIHAEMDALSRVADPQGAVFYIARVSKHGERRFSRPCRNCMAALAAAGVKRVIYTVDQ